MTQEIIEMAQECGLVGMRPHLDGIYIESLLAFAKLVADKALAEHAMREVQRLGQEIEQKIGCVNHDCDQCKAQPEQEPCGWQFFQGGKWQNGMETNNHRANTEAAGIPVRDVYPSPQRTEQEPVATVQCVNGITIGYLEVMQPVGTKLFTTPPQRTWVGLTEQDLDYLCNLAYTGDEEFALAVQAKLMEKNA